MPVQYQLHPMPFQQRQQKMRIGQPFGAGVGAQRMMHQQHAKRLRSRRSSEQALEPLFTQIPDQVDLFDRGISQGDSPRLWIDVVAHVLMGRDKRIYRFVQDTRFGRIVIAESHEVAVIVEAVTDYVARRMIEREHALVASPAPQPVVIEKPRRSRFWIFVLGFLAGALALFGLALFASLRNL